MYQYPYGNAQQLNLDWILNKLQELEAGSGGSADLEEVANALISASYEVQNYNKSDIVFYNGKLYRANQNITAEAWNDAHWDEILLGDTVANLVRYVGSLNNSQVLNSSSVAGVHTSDALNNLSSGISGLNGAVTSLQQAQQYHVGDTFTVLNGLSFFATVGSNGAGGAMPLILDKPIGNDVTGYSFTGQGINFFGSVGNARVTGCSITSIGKSGVNMLNIYYSFPSGTTRPADTVGFLNFVSLTITFT